MILTIHWKIWRSKQQPGKNSGQLAQRLHELVDSSGNQRKTPILNHLLIGFPEQCDCLSNFTTIASKTIKCQTSATRRYTQYYYFFLYAPYKSDTGVFSNIWISFLCALCSLKISARLLPPKARPIPLLLLKVMSIAAWQVKLYLTWLFLQKLIQMRSFFLWILNGWFMRLSILFDHID